MKLPSDILFLVLAAPKRSLLIFSERSMFELCQKEASLGRIPEQLEFFHAPLPPDLAAKLADAKKRSSDESLGIARTSHRHSDQL
jgi:hypothetical protein